VFIFKAALDRLTAELAIVWPARAKQLPKATYDNHSGKWE